jgi:ATP-dependent exoDNAse (exonuclease V) beta subunit
MLNNTIIKTLEEKMRVFYVAMTRAEHILVLATKHDKDKLAYLAGLGDYVSWYKWVGSIK